MDTNHNRRKPPIKPFMAGLALGVLAGWLGMYLHQPEGETGQAIEPAPVDCVPAAQKPAADPSPIPKDPKDFEFYGVLEKAPVTPARPDLEQPLVPPSMAPAAPSSTPPTVAKPFYLQIASFKAAADADALKARIVLAGAPAAVVAMDIPEKGTHYRVRVGPFANQEELSKAKAQLGQGGIELGNAFVVR